MIQMLTIRDFRNTPARLWKTLKRDGAAALSANGVPKAVVFNVEDGDIEEIVQLVTQVRAQKAVARMRAEAAERKLDTMTTDEIDAEIAAVRHSKGR
jgi:hypothetical protein